MPELVNWRLILSPWNWVVVGVSVFILISVLHLTTGASDVT